MGRIAVVDTETNWNDVVMSIGIVLADDRSFDRLDSRYYIFVPECQVGGMYSDVMELAGAKMNRYAVRTKAMSEIIDWLKEWRVQRIFAYNACFDRMHLSELSHLEWYDIMRLAAYRQYNTQIPASTPCFKTGRMKRQYGVEPMLRMLSGDNSYCETHNALYDAADELQIMKRLGLPIERYDCARLS